jgi:hypothetical protein
MLIDMTEGQTRQMGHLRWFSLNQAEGGSAMAQPRLKSNRQ